MSCVLFSFYPFSEVSTSILHGYHLWIRGVAVSDHCTYKGARDEQALRNMFKFFFESL